MPMIQTRYKDGQSAPANEAGDMLYGMRAIAEFLGIRPRQALHLVEAGHLPHFRIGKPICSRRSTLTAWLAEREAQGRQPAA